MTLPRFFVAPEVLGSGSVTLEGALAHQIRRVLRLRVGEHVVLLDGRAEYEVELSALTRDGAQGQVIAQRLITTEPRTQVTLLPALLKHDKFEWVLQKCTELGVSAFRPLISERCVADEVSERRLERWQQIVREAAEQSGRGIIPRIEAPMEFMGAARTQAHAALSLLADEHEHEHTLREQAQHQPDVTVINLFVGPEGGFSDLEIDVARRHRIKAITLGPRILRAETASVVAAALVLHEWGEFA